MEKILIRFCSANERDLLSASGDKAHYVGGVEGEDTYDIFLFSTKAFLIRAFLQYLALYTEGLAQTRLEKKNWHLLAPLKKSKKTSTREQIIEILAMQMTCLFKVLFCCFVKLFLMACRED